MTRHEALERNVKMHQLVMDSVAKQGPGFAIDVSGANNEEDLGLRGHAERPHKGALVLSELSARAEDPTTKTAAEKEAFYLVVATAGLKHTERVVCWRAQRWRGRGGRGGKCGTYSGPKRTGWVFLSPLWFSVSCELIAMWKQAALHADRI
jgi:hypothetical protein